MQRGETRHPIQMLWLSVLTCCLYAVWFVFFALPRDINRGLGLEEFDGRRELLLTVLTCGVWGLWYWWRLCEALVQVQRAWGVPPVMRSPVMFYTLFVGMGPSAAQWALNNAWENGTPGGFGYGSYYDL
ncbi:hypothetical protein FIV42_03705 [Persicimonas caeni]|uniref:DUF4234 domain-containing protein n=1 Tax=Persicimonas caeni TaxID=2292766 RepID=A0A4Y6PNI5_PERCE|nr:DUF4234 domain-containing protein [Persicimonas caeni]QDG49876.1 hypothetical protein FIV42_03705 [Persicimonas caeni]QED31097.1 hypothetical protein FRD00_03700 [Persicimonas caeni]